MGKSSSSAVPQIIIAAIGMYGGTAVVVVAAVIYVLQGHGLI